MIKAVKFLSAFLSIIIIAAAWGMYTTVSARLESEQAKLLAYARECVSNKIYDKGITAFIEVISKNTGNNDSLLYELANVYKESQAFQQYRNLLRDLINRGASPEGTSLADLYIEAVEYDMASNARVSDLIGLLRDGAKKTGDIRLIDMYEEKRYTILVQQGTYDEAGIIFDGAGLVLYDGLWGFVDGRGSEMIEPAYDLATNFRNYAVVQKDAELFIINKNRRRQAVAGFTVVGLTYFDGASFPVMLDGENEYVMANWQGGEEIYITKGEAAYQFIGLPSDSIRALKLNDKWAVIDQSNRKEYIAPDYVYDGIALDEFGRCAINGAVFVKEGGQYSLLDYSGKKLDGSFDDAKPFFEQGGLAAVKNGNKWGFVNAFGDVVIDFIYDDAGSSSLGLAPVKLGEFWGYVVTDGQFMGNIAIELQYYEAKQFVNGCAPVKGEDGWYYIMLAEYE